MVVGAVQRDRSEHGVDPLGPVADEPGLMPGAAVDPRTAVAGVEGQQPLRQRRAERGHRGPDRGLDHAQTTLLPGVRATPGVAVQGVRGQLAQPRALGRERLTERRVEPPFSPSLPVGPFSRPPPASSASGETGLARQIAAFTSTSSSTSRRNRL